MLLRAYATSAYVGLGANLGEARRTVLDVLRALNDLRGCMLKHRSRLYRSAPVDADGPDFVNAVAEVTTHLTAPDLLCGLQQLEHAAGRCRSWRNAPRTLDLDLLLYGSARIDSPGLVVPHPRMATRAFVLRPLAEIAPEYVPAWMLASVAAQDCKPLADDPQSTSQFA